MTSKWGGWIGVGFGVENNRNLSQQLDYWLIIPQKS